VAPTTPATTAALTGTNHTGSLTSSDYHSPQLITNPRTAQPPPTQPEHIHPTHTPARATKASTPKTQPPSLPTHNYHSPCHEQPDRYDQEARLTDIALMRTNGRWASTTTPPGNSTLRHTVTRSLQQPIRSTPSVRAVRDTAPPTRSAGTSPCHSSPYR
jgi:hypothetical protein